MIEIIPALMPQTFKELEDKVGNIHRSIKTMHLDVMDGSVTPSVNWPFVGEGLKEMEKISSGEIGLPFWKEINYEVDIMMQDPEESLAEWVNAGFHRVIIHTETTQKILSMIKEWQGVVELGIAVGIETSNEDVYKYVDAGADFVQFMGIYQIGFQGNPFDNRVFSKISKMREVYPKLPISVDGGVNMDTARKLLEAGADRLVIGSAIFKSDLELKGFEGFEIPSSFDIRKSVDAFDTASKHESGYVEEINAFKKLASEYSAETAKTI